AEDGIRDFHVTGVQTCALPILMEVARGMIFLRSEDEQDQQAGIETLQGVRERDPYNANATLALASHFDEHQRPEEALALYSELRSEERRVGKECGAR